VDKNVPWFQRFIFIIFIAKGRGKINLWNQGNKNVIDTIDAVVIHPTLA
jgi:hypothetical protein